LSDPVLAHLDGQRGAILERLLELVRAPSIGADPAYADGMETARRLLLRQLSAMGLDRVQLLEAGGQPAVYGEWLGAPDRPTLIVYGHYDVQPPDPVEKWASPPFEPTLRNGRLYGRGVSDDKAPTAIALETLAGFLAVEGRLPVNVKVLVEGEEETGSASLHALLETHRDLLEADAVISADGGRWRADLPTVNVGTRGNCGFEVTVTTAMKDLHSGRYGGAVPNACHAMAALLASLRTPDGAIAVEDFYDGIEPPPAAETIAMAEIPFDEQAFYEGLGAEPYGERGFTTLERLWLRPTLDVNGMWGGYTGAGSKTVIPSEAHAKLTMRLVPGQDPGRVQDAVRRHLQRHCPRGARLAFGPPRGASAAYEVSPEHPLLLAVEEALEATLGRKPLRVRMGATLPLTAIVSEMLGLDTVMFSFATSDEDYHAPNEFFRLSSLDEGLAGWVRLLRRLGGQEPEDYARFRRGTPGESRPSA
jgi:acetylornithine deacetylase/succinyl-diaminopimelate desuccinylase-like protein